MYQVMTSEWSWQDLWTHDQIDITMWLNTQKQLCNFWKDLQYKGYSSRYIVYLKKKAEGKISDLVQGHCVPPKGICPCSWAEHKHPKGRDVCWTSTPWSCRKDSAPFLHDWVTCLKKVYAVCRCRLQMSWRSWRSRKEFGPTLETWLQSLCGYRDMAWLPVMHSITSKKTSLHNIQFNVIARIYI